MKNQPCWNCKKCYGDCSWSFDFTPIKGWDAVETIMCRNDQPYSSYKINYCPEFEKEEEKKETFEMLANKYGVSKRTIARWLRLGVIKKCGGDE